MASGGLGGHCVVEWLNRSQIEQFLALSNDDGFVDDPGLRQIVMETYPTVIRLSSEEMWAFDRDYRHGGEPPSYHQNGIVIFLTYTSDADEYNGEEGNRLYQERLDFVTSMVVELNQTLPERWSGYVDVIRDSR